MSIVKKNVVIQLLALKYNLTEYILFFNERPIHSCKREQNKRDYFDHNHQNDTFTKNVIIEGIYILRDIVTRIVSYSI